MRHKTVIAKRVKHTLSDEEDSETELQNAFACGLLQPGLNIIEKNVPQKDFTNDVKGLTDALERIQLRMKWIERLDLVNDPAPLAPELALQVDEHQKKRERHMNTNKTKFDIEKDPVHNDFLREMGFYRQAQAAVLEGIPRLHKAGVKTKRPEDYFAEMAKSDHHMHKVRRRLLNKQLGTERAEKVRKLREMKKFGKKVQVERELEKSKAKRELMEEVKKYRKGLRKDLDFLENKPQKKASNPNPGSKQDKRENAKRKFKDTKYGFGGRKKGWKKNTKEDSMDAGPRGRYFTKKNKTKAGKAERPGKGRRQQMRNRAKRK